MRGFSKAQLLDMIGADGEAQQRLHAAARAARDAAFGQSVVVRAVIEVTNICRVNCDYCPMRRDNTKQNATYILGPDDILSAAESVRDAGINVLVLQGGEIPQTTALAAKVLPEIRRMFDDRVEVLLGLGIKSDAEYRLLKERGASSYIIKHETSDAALHQTIRGESLDGRLRAIRTLLSLGYRVGTGCIVGLPGQTTESLADDIVLADALGVHMCSASPFVPTRGTPFETAAAGSIATTLNVIATMRLVNPRWLVPAVSALEQQSSGGQGAALRAGANVITVNFTPKRQRERYLIYGDARHVVSAEYVRRQLSHVGLEPRGSIWVNA